MTQGVRWYARRGDIKRLFDEDQHVESTWTFESPIYLGEIPAALADIAAYGQIWVKTATPNELWFTDDGGTDHQLTGGAGFDDHFTSVYISEQAAAQADDAGYGQVWVSNTYSPGMVSEVATFTPLTSSLWYTTAGGIDVPLVADAQPVLVSLWNFLNTTGFFDTVRLHFDPGQTGSAVLELNARTGDPITPSDAVFLYAKGEPAQLYCKNDAGTVTQLTF